MKKQGKMSGQAHCNKPCHKYSGLLQCADCGCSFAAKVRKTKGNPDRVEYVYNGYHRYSEGNCTSHRMREEILDEIVKCELEGIRLVFDDLWENVEADVKKWAAGKSTAEKRLKTLKDKIIQTEQEIIRNRDLPGTFIADLVLQVFSFVANYFLLPDFSLHTYIKRLCDSEYLSAKSRITVRLLLKNIFCHDLHIEKRDR